MPWLILLMVLAVVLLISLARRNENRQRLSAKDLIDRLLAYEDEIWDKGVSMTAPQLKLLQQQLEKKYGLHWVLDPDHENHYSIDVNFSDTMSVHYVGEYDSYGKKMYVKLISEEHRGYRLQIAYMHKAGSLKEAAKISIGDKGCFSRHGMMDINTIRDMPPHGSRRKEEKLFEARCCNDGRSVKFNR